MKIRFLLAALFVALPAAADEITDALGASQQSLRTARESQQRIVRLDDEARGLREKRRAIEWQAQQIAAYARELETLAETEDRQRQELESQLARAAAIGRELQPLLERMVAELERFVAVDLPFLAQQRAQRVAELKALVADPARGVTDKYRRLLDAYRSEVDYGHSLGVEDGTIPLDGRSAAATLVRIGRIGFYYVTADGAQAGYWHHARRQWQALDGDAADGVRRALALARGEVPPELLVLPVATPQAPPS